MREKIVSIWSIAAVMVLFLTMAPLVPSNSHSKEYLSQPPMSVATAVQAENCAWWSKLNPFG